MNTPTRTMARRPGPRARALAPLALAALLLQACTAPGGNLSAEAGVPLEVRSEAELYNQAQRQLDAGNYLGATVTLQILLDKQHFGRYAEQARLDLMYALLLSSRPEVARANAEFFLRLNPQHPNADYAFFIRGLSAFMDDYRFSSRFFSMDLAHRDISPVRQSFEELREYVTLFPTSPYAPTARRRLVQLRELMARKEIVVASYYLRRRASVAALNRANWTLTRLPNSRMTPWALAVQVLAYKQMVLPNEADEALQMLRGRFPEHEALQVAQASRPDTFELPSEEVTITELLTLGLFRAYREDEQHVLQQ